MQGCVERCKCRPSACFSRLEAVQVPQWRSNRALLMVHTSQVQLSRTARERAHACHERSSVARPYHINMSPQRCYAAPQALPVGHLHSGTLCL
jgi:hypothetical protein